MLRLFFALQPTPAQNLALVTAAAPLIVPLAAQPVPAESLHATLCFIGAVAEERIDALVAAAQAVRGRKVVLRFDQLDYWMKPRVLCATARDEATFAPASELSMQLGAAAVAAGFAPDLKPFRAHLTLARKIDAARAAECEWPLALAPPVSVHCDHFVLMRSERKESGSTYSVVTQWPLYGNDTA
jgi:2'-5' RNA ligase